jgi:hypothetical protein
MVKNSLFDKFPFDFDKLHKDAGTHPGSKHKFYANIDLNSPNGPDRLNEILLKYPNAIKSDTAFDSLGNIQFGFVAIFIGNSDQP